MDGNRFDDLTRRLASDSSRRSFLKRAAATVAVFAGLGSAAETDAQRRPTPTPRPPRCPGIQIWNGNACVCPSGEQCGSDCCGAGSTCCDGACCFGTCYGEELCCPTGQIVCNGVCLPAGQCCVDTDCRPGFACIGNICVCQPTTSCATAGLNCGAFTDDCGAVLDCGVCSAPFTCGGGGTPGVCGCRSSLTCDGRCGVFTDECGEQRDCGNPCGICQTCTNNACVPLADGADCDSSACVQGAICLGGVCSGGQPIVCPEDPADRCNRSECDPVQGCVKVPTNEGNACKSLPCDPGICRAGVCDDDPIECPECQQCEGGACVAGNDGGTCADGLRCFGGNCCNMPTIDGVVPDDEDVLQTCFDTDQICCDASAGPCCPGTSQCCDFCVTIDGDGGRPAYNRCCPPAQQCNGVCCWDTDTCIGGACVNRNQVCAGNVVCNDKCCGATGEGTGACCGPDAYCVNGACVAEQPNACMSHDDCESIYGSSGICAGMSINLGTGQVNPGTCCPGAYARLITSGANAGQYTCCDPETRPTAFGCCEYPEYDCLNCTCSAVRVRRWGS